MTGMVLDQEGLQRISKLIDCSSFGTDAVVELSKRAPAEDVVAVCAAAEGHEAAGPRFPYVPTDASIVETSATGPGNRLSLDELAEMAAAGDRRAMELLLARIYTISIRYCRARLGRDETAMGSAEDVAQEVCISVISALPTYRSKGLSFQAFFYGIAAHKVTDAVRASNRARTQPVAHTPDRPDYDSPEEHVLVAETGEEISQLLRTLTTRQQEVLVLRIAVGLSAEDTASLIGVTPQSVRLSQHRALNRLRSLLNTAKPPPVIRKGEVVQIDWRSWWHDRRNHPYIELVIDGSSEFPLSI